MKIKYGINDNCRNTIHEKPQEHIVTRRLQNTKQITVKKLYSWKGFSVIRANSLALLPGLGMEWQARGRKLV